MHVKQKRCVQHMRLFIDKRSPTLKGLEGKSFAFISVGNIGWTLLLRLS